MSIWKSILYTGTVAGLAGLAFTFASQQSGHAASFSNSSNAKAKFMPVQHRSTVALPHHKTDNARPVYGALKHDYTNWTLNGHTLLWNRPANAGKRHAVLSKKTVGYIAQHSSHMYGKRREPAKYIFTLNDTATYHNHQQPDYYYLTSDNSLIHGWAYKNGLTEVGQHNSLVKSKMITTKADVYTPTQNRVTKHDREYFHNTVNSLAYDRLSHDKSDYRSTINTAFWYAKYLGKRNHRTRAQLVKLVKRSIKDSDRMLRHAHRSRAYYHKLTRDDYRYLLE